MKKFIRKNLVIMLIIFFSAAIIVISGVLLWNAYKEYGDGFKYFEQGIVITLAVGGGCVSLVSAIIQNKKQIDADLKAKARIEWIQKVREATAVFVTECYEVLREKSKNETTNTIGNKYPIIREKGYLLKMYFGNDKKEHQCKIKCEEKQIILCKENNSGKNEYINKRIDNIIDYFWGTRLLKAKNRDFESLLYAISGQNDERKKEVEERLQYDSISIDEVKNLKEYKDYCNTEKILRKTVMNELDEFVDIIRLYLKIEWDRAKNNEDDD